MVGDGGLAVFQRGVAGGSGEIDEVFAAGLGIFIDFKGGVGVSALSVLGELVLVDIRAVNVAGVGRFSALSATVAEGRIYAFVEQFWGCSSCSTLTFKVFGKAVQSVGARCAVGRDPR